MYYERSLQIALLPVSLPAFGYFLIRGEPRFMWLVLLGYAALLVVLFRSAKIRAHKEYTVIIAAIILVVHVVLFFYMVEQFRAMGAAIGKQLIGK
ncbi:MAG: hypothetical protein HYY59_03285 [Candidatus Omnitrophica bacterium]|nr:hypothetical protein [Candidatus Omnitrophota bacterium]MBI3021008.1 hypothetical protein [Candidatus Omnitrophota bacterium]